MSVIGYDGKIRPKSVAVNYKPQGMMSPEDMERLHAARPDFVKDVMKMFDSIGRDYVELGDTLDKQRKEREAVEDKEKMLDDDRKLSEARNSIEANRDLTAQQRVDAWDEHMPKAVSGGTLRDRRIYNQTLSTWSRTRSVFQAQAIREQDENAEAARAERNASRSAMRTEAMAASTPEGIEAARKELEEEQKKIPPEGEGSARDRVENANWRKDLRTDLTLLQEKCEKSKQVLKETESSSIVCDFHSKASKEFADRISWLAQEGVDLSDVVKDFDTFYLNLAKEHKGMARLLEDESLKPYLDKAKAAFLTANIAGYAEAMAASNDAKAKQNVSISSAAASLNAANAASAYGFGIDVVNKYPDLYPDELSRVQHGVSVGCGWLTNYSNGVGKQLDELQNWAASPEAAEMAKSNPNQFSKTVEENDTKIRKGVENAKHEIRDNVDDILQEIDDNELLTPEQKTVLKKTVTTHQYNLLSAFDQAKVARIANARNAAGKTKETVNANLFDNLRGTLRNDGTTLDPANAKIFKLMTPDADFAAKFNAKTVEETGATTGELLHGYISVHYPGLKDSDARQRVVYDLRFAVTNLDLNQKGGANLERIYEILHSAARLLGADSDEYRDFCIFVKDNIVNEKNHKDSVAVFNRHLFPNKSDEDIKKAINGYSNEERAMYESITTYLSEFSGEVPAYEKEAERLAKLFKNTKAVTRIVSAAELPENLFSAGVEAKKEAEESKKRVYNRDNDPVVKQATEAEEAAKLEVLDGGGSAEDAEAAGKEAREQVFEKANENEYPDLWTTFTNMFRSHEGAYYASREVAVEDFKASRQEVDGMIANKKQLKQNEAQIRTMGPDAWNEYEHMAKDKSVNGKLNVSRRFLEERRARAEMRSGIEQSRQKRDRERNDAEMKKDPKGYFAEREKNEQKLSGLSEDEAHRGDGTTKGPGWYGSIEFKTDKGDSFATELSITITKNGVDVDIPLIVPTLTQKELVWLIQDQKKKINAEGAPIAASTEEPVLSDLPDLQMPTLTLSKDDDAGKNKPEDDEKMYNRIVNKAIAWAEERWAEGKSPYIEKNEPTIGLPQSLRGLLKGQEQKK